MIIISINLGYFGSTGGIMRGIQKKVNDAGSRNIISYPVSRKYKRLSSNDLCIGNSLLNRINREIARSTGNKWGALFTTYFLIRKIKEINPDIIHLHNIHGGFINLEFLFKMIKENKYRIIWTLHDCWAFTGRCPYFEIAHCDRWKAGCHDCPYPKHDYPAAYVDNTKTMWKLKKKWFTGVENMTIVTPSQWLADLVKQSYLKDYPIKVIHNGIDLSVFKPTPSDFREKHGISPEKKVLLGVAFGWGRRKGLDVFIELAKRLSNEYQIVLVGTDENTDKLLPENVISIHRTEKQQQLAEIYTTADVFVNPTREENYPTVNMESLACGTPVITFATGGSPEIPDETCGSVVTVDDIDALESEIVRVCTQQPYSNEACLKRAQKFDMNDRFEEYVKLYEELQ